MDILIFPSGPFSTNAYVVSCPLTKHTAIIDPAPGSFAAICQALSDHELLPEKILLTHTHWDHIADVSPLQKKYRIPVYVHKEDLPNLEHPGADKLPCWLSIEGVTPDGFLHEGDRIAVGSLAFEVIHTPGHTPGGVCFYAAEAHVLFSGDTLFQGSIGNLSFPTCCPDLMWGSLDKLAKLPTQTKVYPGHGPATTIGAESWLPRAKQVFGK